MSHEGFYNMLSEILHLLESAEFKFYMSWYF